MYIMPPSSVSVAELIDNIINIEDAVTDNIEAMSNTDIAKDQEAVGHRISAGLRQLRELGEQLQLLANEQDKEQDMIALLEQANVHKGIADELRRSLRDARYRWKNAASRDSDNRKSLLGERQQQRHRGHETLLNTTTSTTESLRRSTHMLSEQLQRSTEALETLATSGKVLRDVHNEFTTMGGMVGQAKQLISKMKQRDIADRLMIGLAVLFFFAIVLYVASRRIL